MDTLFFYMAVVGGTFLAIQTLWAGPWLRDVAGLDSTALSFVLLAGAAALRLRQCVDVLLDDFIDALPKRPHVAFTLEQLLERSARWRDPHGRMLFIANFDGTCRSDR